MKLDSGKREVPILRQVDVLLVGGTGAGVALAEALAAEGASVFLAGSRPYLGEDIGGDMWLWLDQGEMAGSALSRAVYGEAGKTTPMHAKLTLEQGLVTAGVPFLLNVHPTGVVRDDHGHVCGVRFASRSGTFCILARLVVDATTEGSLGRMIRAPMIPVPQGKQQVVHTTLCMGEGTDAPGVPIAARPEGFDGVVSGTTYHLSARRYVLEVDFGNGTLRDLARAESDIVGRCWVPGEYLHQERVRLLEPEQAESRPRSLTDLREDQGVLLFTPSASVAGGRCSALVKPWQAIDLASALAVSIMGSLARRPAPQSSSLGIEPIGTKVKSGRVRVVNFARRLSAEDLGSLSEDSDRVPVLDRFDVLVLGGGTAGAPAAIAAARAGANTLVVEATDLLGGVGTSGQIARYWCGNRVGFTAEVDRKVAALEVDPRLAENTGQWSVSAKAEWFHRECRDGGVTALFRSLACGVWVDEERVRGLVVASPYGYGLIEAGCVVDASGCADVPAAAGAPVRQITGQHIAVQGTGLAGLLPGRDYHNSDHGFCDDSDVFDSTAFLVTSKLKFRAHFDAGQLVDSRERRQIIGEVSLDPADFLSERRYPDTISVSSSNFDSHGFTVHPVFMCKPPHKKRLWADVPLRAFLPRGLERVLVTGLGMSAHRDALPVVRMQPDVQNHGYAAGYLAALSARTRTDLRALPIRDLQRHLVDTGSLPERVLTDHDNFPVDDAALSHAIAERWDEYDGLALIFAEPERARPMLRAAWREAEGARRLRYALVLALIDDHTGARDLLEAVSGGDWDAGWNFRGMHQFGMSLSEMDVLLIALGRVGNDDAWPAILRKVDALPEAAEFSHLRALVEASETLYRRHPNPEIGERLATVLRRPGYSGHAKGSFLELERNLNDDPEDNATRNAELRELHLARGIFRCGDPEGQGRRILERYAGGLRAHYARHAAAILSERAGP